ncbi:ATP-binding protein [Alcanivorax sp. S71-1-4]|nr:ATP-binding protein [Alcanivorax sp. S71-1-4]
MNKTVEQLTGRIDHHLERIDEAKTYGGWNTAAYFIGDSTASSEALGSIFLGLIRGNKSSHESFAITTWNSREKDKKEAIAKWISSLEHPRIKSGFSGGVISYVTPATLVSGKELAVQMSMPRRSTSTVSVVETQAFGRKVQYLDDKKKNRNDKRVVTLGNIRHLWENLKQEMELSLDDLSGHVFVSGSTGAGKSNTLYEMLDQLSASGVPFMVIEPAKGEYKHVFGHRPDVKVLGTNPEHSDLLRINPFRFPDGIHVLEHIDRLVEIFNVCWPMYAAMPAVLKDAILQAYQQCGWDLEASVNRYSNGLFPDFRDLLEALEQVIEASAYSQEIKGNYIGSLSTRVKSLTNGLNGQIFTSDEMPSEELFDSSVIVDLSRVGSSETKALIMGILVMRLSEYRIAKGGMNQPLKHVTVLEEAHHILKRSSGSGGGLEGADLAGKSVEMLASAIAEMRTYGEGFFIVDQSPNAVDIAAIRNTNTKIIMRLPDEVDRRLIGKSVALRDEQLEEIARLPKGVAIVYQNDWLEPVLCQVRKFAGEEKSYVYRASEKAPLARQSATHPVLNFLLAKRLSTPANLDLDFIERAVDNLPLSVRLRIPLYEAISLQKKGKSPRIQEPGEFANLSRLVVDILGCRRGVISSAQTAIDYADFHRRLRSQVLSLLPEVNGETALALEHCLVKDYSLQKEEHIEIYSAWKQSLEGRVVR